ncbi:PfkB family carbohydrate kinase [Chitinophaga solisilvae]|uniref:PfkB family carbohydrate kinase n=1 Tax=Chitinophaga solisilvae TaxID=1233460 RepID=UPI00136B96DE|nr:PfkB family carbohydrate kinase [Chitinophaga solisilvae]
MQTHLISEFKQFNVLVIGDLMLDVYLNGACNRLAPEAPVPVVDILSSNISLGGAANTAMNLAGLGAAVTFCSIAGYDDNGHKAIRMLEDAGISCQVLKDRERSTIVKTRVMSGNQLLVRYDAGTESPVSDAAAQAFAEILQEQYALHDAVLIADYDKGVITQPVLDMLEALQADDRKFIAVDSKRLQYFRRLSPALVKPNYKELMQLLQVPPVHTGRVQQVNTLGAEAFAATGAALTIVTLDEEGAVIFERDQPAYRSHAHQVQVFHVAGAGDTYVSAFTLAMLAGADITIAAELSSAAAAVAISKKVTAHCTWQELDMYMSVREKFITDPQQLEYISALYRAQGRKIVFTNGCFDILHNGHVSYLNKARELGDVLMIGINVDDSIRRLKGSNRPINTLKDRMEVLAGLSAVTHIIPFGDVKDDTASPLIRLIRPHVYTKAADYTIETLPEKSSVEEGGGEVILLPLLPDRSTTLIVNKINTVYG